MTAPKTGPATDIIAIVRANLALAIASLSGSFLAAVLFILESDSNRAIDEATGKPVPWTEDTATNLWQDALTRAIVTKARIDAAEKQLGTLESFKLSGLIPDEIDDKSPWFAVLADFAKLADAIESAKEDLAKKKTGILADTNDRSEAVWKDAVAFATHWGIVPNSESAKPFKVDVRRKNPSLVSLAESLGFTVDPADEVKVLKAVGQSKSLRFAS